MRRALCGVIVILAMFVAVIATAADLDVQFAAPKPPVRGGDTIILDVYLHDNTPDPITRELPTTLPCRIDTGRSTSTTTAELVGGSALSRVEVPGGGFARRQYRVPLPIYARGSVNLTVEALAAHPLTILVEPAPPEAWVGQQVPLDEGPTLVQSYLENLSVYEPMYFLLGVDPGLEQSKFQLSFKYRLFNSQGLVAEKAPWVSGFHLGYTQRSIWDLADESKPFEDTSYLPEIFYLWPKIELNAPRITAFGIQAGFQHESNGKGGDDSRSTNNLYVEPIMGMPLAGPFHLKIAPRLFAYLNNSAGSNSDLWAYRGYVDLGVGVIDPDGFALDSHLWWAKNGATVQVDLSYPLTRLLSRSLNLYLQAQYFSGYAETLLHYNERHDAIRVGVSIVR